MTKEMFEEITGWQRKTFPQATALSTANHLAEEVEELIVELKKKSFYSAYEYADCFLLLFGSARLAGLSYDDICKYIDNKMILNKNRQWGDVNEKGYVKHVSISEQDDAVSDTTKMPKERDDGQQTKT